MTFQLNVSEPIFFFKWNDDAVFPSKAHEDDAGYDITLLGIHTKEDVTKNPKRAIRCSTGISVITPPGYYTELVIRSSFGDSGYIIPNTPSIIDEGYTGELFVQLLKVVPEAPDIQFPIKAAQLILRKNIRSDARELNKVEFNEKKTKRGAGAFGSSDNKLFANGFGSNSVNSSTNLTFGISEGKRIKIQEEDHYQGLPLESLPVESLVDSKIEDDKKESESENQPQVESN